MTPVRVLVIAACAALAACSAEESSPRTEAETQAGASTRTAVAAAPAAPDTAGAEVFLREALAMYASPAAYTAAEKDEAALAERGTPAQVGRLFTPRLADSLNRAYAAEGGVDMDPICMCQDDSGMVVGSMQTALQPDGRVRATVAFGDRGALIYTLEQTPAGWRIADVLDRGAAGEAGVGLVETLSERQPGGLG